MSNLKMMEDTMANEEQKVSNDAGVTQDAQNKGNTATKPKTNAKDEVESNAGKPKKQISRRLSERDDLVQIVELAVPEVKEDANSEPSIFPNTIFKKDYDQMIDHKKWKQVYQSYYYECQMIFKAIWMEHKDDQNKNVDKYAYKFYEAERKLATELRDSLAQDVTGYSIITALMLAAGVTILFAAVDAGINGDGLAVFLGCLLFSIVANSMAIIICFLSFANISSMSPMLVGVFMTQYCTNGGKHQRRGWVWSSYYTWITFGLISLIVAIFTGAITFYEVADGASMSVTIIFAFICIIMFLYLMHGTNGYFEETFMLGVDPTKFKLQEIDFDVKSPSLRWCLDGICGFLDRNVCCLFSRDCSCCKKIKCSSE